MRRYTNTGAPVPNHMREVEDPFEHHRSLFHLKRGYVQAVVFPDDSDNITGRLEYVVNIGGQDYQGVIDVSHSGGIFSNHVRVRSAATIIEATQTRAANQLGGPQIYEEKKSGETVWCLFINGDGDVPIIVGSDIHPRITDNGEFKNPSKSLGQFERYEFNSVEFLINKDGELSIKFLDPLDPTGSKRIPNPLSASGWTFEVKKDGQTNLKVKGPGGVNVEIDQGDLIAKLLQGNVQVEATAGNISAKATAGDISVEATAGKLSGKAGQDISIESTGGNISAKATVGNITAEATAGSASVKAAQDISVESTAGKISAKAATGITAESTTGNVSVKATAGSATMEGVGGAKVKVGTAKVGIGAPAGEVVALLEQTLTHIDAILTNIAALTVGTAVGPSSPPINVAAFTAIQAQVNATKTIVTTIKGGI